MKTIFALLSLGVIGYVEDKGEEAAGETVHFDFELVKPPGSGGSELESVPYFLYNEVVNEREELEAKLAELTVKLKRSENHVQSLVNLLKEFSSDLKNKGLPDFPVETYLSRIPDDLNRM